VNSRAKNVLRKLNVDIGDTVWWAPKAKDQYSIRSFREAVVEDGPMGCVLVPPGAREGVMYSGALVDVLKPGVTVFRTRNEAENGIKEHNDKASVLQRQRSELRRLKKEMKEMKRKKRNRARAYADKLYFQAFELAETVDEMDWIEHVAQGNISMLKEFVAKKK